MTVYAVGKALNRIAPVSGQNVTSSFDVYAFGVSHCVIVLKFVFVIGNKKNKSPTERSRPLASRLFYAWRQRSKKHYSFSRGKERCVLTWSKWAFHDDALRHPLVGSSRRHDEIDHTASVEIRIQLLRWTWEAVLNSRKKPCEASSEVHMHWSVASANPTQY